MIVNPGLRRSISGGVAGLLRRADINLSAITHSAIPTRGALTPSFTRATEKRIPDHEGVLRTLIAGELGFPGARRVYNKIPTTSENFDNAAWTKSAAGGGSAPVVTADQDANPVSGVAFADKVVFSAPASGDISFLASGAVGVASGNKGLASFYIKAFAAGDVGKTILIRHVGAAAYSTYTLTESYVRVSSVETSSGTSSTFGIGLRPSEGGSTGTVSVYLAAVQLENITGRTDQTTPSEYVSVGVESSPAYHGSMVDGVKCFPVDLDGTPLTAMTTPLIELAATNLCLQSQTFGTAPWNDPTGGGADLAVAVNQYVAPDGTTTADQLTAQATTSFHVLRQGSIPTAATTYTASIYLRYVSHRWVGLQLFDGTTVRFASFDLLNGVVGSLAAGTTSTITQISSGVYRVSMTGLLGVSANCLFDIALNNTDATAEQNYLGTGTSVGAWGAQLEAGTAATSYIPTTTVAATRNADQLYYTGADIANIKTLYAEPTFFGTANAATNFTILDLNDGGTTTNSMVMRLEGGTLLQKSFCYSGSALQANLDHTIAYVNGVQHKTAFTVGTNSAISVLDGGDVKTDATTTPPVGCVRLSIAMTYTGVQQLNGYPGKIYGWTRNLSQSELGAITQ